MTCRSMSSPQLSNNFKVIDQSKVKIIINRHREQPSIHILCYDSWNSDQVSLICLDRLWQASLTEQIRGNPHNREEGAAGLCRGSDRDQHTDLHRSDRDAGQTEWTWWSLWLSSKDPVWRWRNLQKDGRPSNSPLIWNVMSVQMKLSCVASALSIMSVGDQELLITWTTPSTPSGYRQRFSAAGTPGLWSWFKESKVENLNKDLVQSSGPQLKAHVTQGRLAPPVLNQTEHLWRHWTQTDRTRDQGLKIWVYND